jgi:hypothetical protein
MFGEIYILLMVLFEEKRWNIKLTPKLQGEFEGYLRTDSTS